ncbi:ATP synthase F0 subunit 6 (mitochondrion) [Ruditapes philippinarum]|uniref:F-ATPase protein 6 n=1 Tax=Ruditapes philippinarum TaxID=129788 RepID=A0A0H4SM57_RUDPH|nr:ATP synthase F0 subunit 6 [Ruditapes philippinarum]AKP94716.1 ATP synthase subunit 6 [Ruditapes philippinarum]
MTSDLFSMFDCVWGAGSALSRVSVWISGLIIVFVSFNFLVFFYNMNEGEVMIMLIFESIISMLPNKAKVFSGVGHLIVSLYLVLLPFCVVGYFPYSFSLGAQIAITTSLSFPFFIMTVAMGFTPNWYLGFVKMVYDGSHFLIKFLVVVSELVGLMLRPFTLAIRMSLNLAVGSMMLKIFCSMTVGLLFPFTYSIFSFGGPVVSGLIFSVFSLLFSGVELCMGILQSIIFCMLIVFYCGDILVKPE